MDKELLFVIFMILGVGGALLNKEQSTQAALAVEEAQLQLLHITRLEQAYLLDNGHFVGFEEPYGAEERGVDHCLQPAGAKDLGFRLRNCTLEVENVSKPRYFYTIKLLKPNDLHAKGGFIATAISGSGDDLKSTVCLANEQDVWTIDTQKKLQHVNPCLQK